MPHDVTVTWRGDTTDDELGEEWLFVDYGPELIPFYERACGFRPTRAGLVRLPAR